MTKFVCIKPIKPKRWNSVVILTASTKPNFTDTCSERQWFKQDVKQWTGTYATDDGSRSAVQVSPLENSLCIPVTSLSMYKRIYVWVPYKYHQHEQTSVTVAMFWRQILTKKLTRTRKNSVDKCYGNSVLDTILRVILFCKAHLNRFPSDKHCASYVQDECIKKGRL